MVSAPPCAFRLKIHDGPINDQPARIPCLAHDARVNYVLEESTVRDWFRMIRDQVRVLTAAS